MVNLTNVAAIDANPKSHSTDLKHVEVNRK